MLNSFTPLVLPMPKFLVSYVVAGDAARREIVFDHVSSRVNSVDVARAIIIHEFPGVADPFTANTALTAGQVLDRFGVTLLRTPCVGDT